MKLILDENWIKASTRLLALGIVREMSPRIAFDPGQISGTADRLRTAADGIESELDRLDAEADRLRSAWSGEATEAYRRAHEQWTTSLRALRGVIADAARAGQTSSDRYAAAQATIAERWA